MAKYVLDTNVYIRAIRSAQSREELAAWQRRMAPHLYQHAVVVAELLAGAKDERTLERWRERWVEPAERVGRVITPDYRCWALAARIVVRLVARRRLAAGGVRPAFFHDCLIAASAKLEGFTVVTHNVDDFRRIAEAEPSLTFAAPFP